LSYQYVQIAPLNLIMNIIIKHKTRKFPTSKKNEYNEIVLQQRQVLNCSVRQCSYEDIIYCLIIVFPIIIKN